MDATTVPTVEPAHKMKKVGSLDQLPGGGQVMVRGNLCFIGHMNAPYDTTIIDVSDPKHPKVIAEVPLDIPFCHSHKTRIANGDVMVTNVERIGRPPADWNEGGVRIWNIADPTKPKLITHLHTWGKGVHRFDMDDDYLYLSTQMEGFVGNILVIYDIKNPAKPTEVSRWWMPGQNTAAGEKPTWVADNNRLHHAMRVGNLMWAACWDAGFRIVDISDITKPKTIGEFDHHPVFRHPTHTIMPITRKINGRDIAVMMDEEAVHLKGQPHAAMWTFDVTDLSKPTPLAIFEVSERDTPWYAADVGGGHDHGGGAHGEMYRFGAHQYQEHLDGTRITAAWFSGGVRVIDVNEPTMPEQVAYYVPEPRGGKRGPQTNDVDTDKRGLVYALDRFQGLDILEVTA